MNQKDSLKSLLTLLTLKNDNIFLKGSFRNKNGKPLTMKYLQNSIKNFGIRSNSENHTWVINLSKAIQMNSEEILDLVSLESKSKKSISTKKLTALAIQQLAHGTALCALLGVLPKTILKDSEKYPQF